MWAPSGRIRHHCPTPASCPANPEVRVQARPDLLDGVTTNPSLVAKSGATFISPFISRLDDIGLDGMELIEEIREIYDNYDFRTKILAASIRTVNHVKQAALDGADVSTVPPATLKALVEHPLTDKGLEAFTATGPGSVGNFFRASAAVPDRCWAVT